jgi:hypothetical protein
VSLLPLFQGLGVLLLLLGMSRMKFSRQWFNLGAVLRHSLRMREDIARAMALSRWLALEARRGISTEEFWQVLQFAADRLGFCQMRLELEDGERVWMKHKGEGGDFHRARYDFRSAGVGVIELQARRTSGEDGSHPPVNGQENRRSGEGLEDERTFLVISELLAESWHKASLREYERTGAVLRFASTPPVLGPAGIPLDRQEQRL